MTNSLHFKKPPINSCKENVRIDDDQAPFGASVCACTEMNEQAWVVHLTVYGTDT